MNEIIKKKVDDWCASSNKIREEISAYSEYRNSFYDLLYFPVKDNINTPFVKEKVALLHKLANEISSMNPDCSTELNKFSGISDIYFCNKEKYESFRSILKREYKKIYEEAVSYEERERKENEASDRRGEEETRRREESQTRQRQNQDQQNYRQQEEYRNRQKNESSNNHNQRNRDSKVKDKSNKKRILTFVILAFLFSIVASYFMYIRPEMQESTYPSYYTVSNLYLRNSPVTSEDSKIILIPAGSKLSVYEHTGDWARVMVRIGKKYEGFVSTAYTLNETDFYLLNNVWADEASQEGVPTAKCRLAILDFLKARNYTTGANEWQLKAKPIEMKPNTVFYPKLNNGYTKFTSFAFILSNATTGGHVLAIYSFQDDETPVFVYSEDVAGPTQIKDVTYRSGNRYSVTYTTTNNKTTGNGTGGGGYNDGISISNVIFRNTDHNGNTIGIQGDAPYVEDVRYIAARLYVDNLMEEKAVMVKITTPSGILMRGDSSPNGYTYSSTIKPGANSDYYDISGWGNRDGGIYKEGTYRFEFWIDNKCLYSADVALQSRKSTTEQVTKNTPISITKVEFANVDNKGNFINIFGDRLYGDKMRYLSSRIYYNTHQKNNSLPLSIKIIRPNGDLISSASSPAGYTVSDILDAGNETTATMRAMLVSWGNNDTSVYPAGTYTYEIWHGNVLLSRSKVTIN